MKNWLSWFVVCCAFSFISNIACLHHVNIVVQDKLTTLERNLSTLATALKGNKKTIEKAPNIPLPTPQPAAKEFLDLSVMEKGAKQAIERRVRSRVQISSRQEQEEAARLIQEWANALTVLLGRGSQVIFEILARGAIFDEVFTKETIKSVFAKNKILLSKIVEDIQKIEKYNLNQINLEHIFYQGQFEQFRDVIIGPAFSKNAPLFVLTQITLNTFYGLYGLLLKSGSYKRDKEFFKDATKEFWPVVDEAMSALRALQKKYGIAYIDILPPIKEAVAGPWPIQKETQDAILQWLGRGIKLSQGQQEAKKAIEQWANNIALYGDAVNQFTVMRILSVPGEIDTIGKKEVKEIFDNNETFFQEIVNSIRKINTYTLDRANLELIFYQEKFDTKFKNIVFSAPGFSATPPLFFLTELFSSSLKQLYQDFLRSKEKDKVMYQRFMQVKMEDFWETLDELLAELEKLRRAYGVPVFKPNAGK